MPKGVYQRPNDETRFWAKVCKNGPHILNMPDKCWIWVGTRIKSGYGIFKWSGKPGLAHRYSYVSHLGRIPIGMFVCHKCDNPSCVNPKHLWIGTAYENSVDRDTKGRQVPRRGEQFTHSKLTDKIVREIRLRYVPHDPIHGTRAMAREFEVSHMLIRQVIHGLIWRHITPDKAIRVVSTNPVCIASRQ